jgi:hypothetical protein
VFDIRLTYLIFNLIYVMKSDGEWRERKKARDSGSMLHAAMMLPSSAAACSHAANRQLPSVFLQHV